MRPKKCFSDRCQESKEFPIDPPLSDHGRQEERCRATCGPVVGKQNMVKSWWDLDGWMWCFGWFFSDFSFLFDVDMDGHHKLHNYTNYTVVFLAKKKTSTEKRDSNSVPTGSSCGEHGESLRWQAFCWSAEMSKGSSSIWNRHFQYCIYTHWLKQINENHRLNGI